MTNAIGKTILAFLSIQIATSCGVISAQVCCDGVGVGGPPSGGLLSPLTGTFNVGTLSEFEEPCLANNKYSILL